MTLYRINKLGAKLTLRSRISFLNSICALISYVVLFLGPFIVSPCLKYFLGSEILGIQKTFQDTVALISIVELGISYGVIYKLYKPIAEKDSKKIAVLLKFYRSAFKFISVAVSFLGLIVAFIMPKIITGKYHSNILNDSFLSFVFLIYVLDSLLTYLFGHKRIMLIADQKNYIATICRTVCQVLMFIMQIIVLFVFKSFLIYSALRPLFTFLESILINYEFGKKYKDINLKTKEKLEKEEKSDLIKTLSALFYHRVGAQSIISGSTLILVHKLGEKLTGLYYPYIFITNGIISATNQVFNAILSSFGNYMAKHSRDETYSLYKKIFFFNYLLFSLFSNAFFCVISPFMNVWMGKDSVFNTFTILLITLNFYFSGIRHSIFMVKASVGLYRPDRYLALLEAVINLVCSYVFSGYFGINGILFASLISTFLVPLWAHPYLVYKNVFRSSVKNYYKKFILYFLITVASGTVSFHICSFTAELSNVLQIVLNLLICTFITGAFNFILFRKTPELKYLFNIFRTILNKFKQRGHKSLAV